MQPFKVAVERAYHHNNAHMLPQSKPLLTSKELKELASRASTNCNCGLKNCIGWESVSDDRWPAAQLVLTGTLRAELPEGQFELSFEEFHPKGTRYDSPQAPIAVDYFPYNRCDVFTCKTCQCAVLKYTEYGGYYVDHRVRLADAEKVLDLG
jgi:hypothetical protein